MVGAAVSRAMPDTAVREANGNLIPMYHGTSNGGDTLLIATELIELSIFLYALAL